MSNVDSLPASLTQRFPPLLLALGAQLSAWLLVVVLAALLRLGNWALPMSAWLVLAGLLAALLARWLALPPWWWLINLAFPPLLWLALGSAIDPIWFLAGFLLLTLTSLGALLNRVPLYLSSPQAAAVLAERLPTGGKLLDLGCGLGGPLARLARLRPDGVLAGVEAAPLNWLIARARLARHIPIHLGNLWDCDLSAYDVVYAYLSPAPMPRLWQKARAEMRPGSLFISNSFGVPGVEPDEVVELHDLSHARLLIWRIR